MVETLKNCYRLSLMSAEISRCFRSMSDRTIMQNRVFTYENGLSEVEKVAPSAVVLWYRLGRDIVSWLGAQGTPQRGGQVSAGSVSGQWLIEGRVALPGDAYAPPRGAKWYRSISHHTRYLGGAGCR